MEVAAHDDAEIGSSNPGTTSGLSASVSSSSSSSSCSKGSSSSSNKGSSSSSSSSSSSRRKVGSTYHNAIGRPDFAYTNNKRKVPAWKDDLKRKVLARAKQISGDAGASTLTASLPLIGAAIACSMPAMGSGVSYTQANVLSSISPTICSSTATSTSLACKRKHSDMDGLVSPALPLPTGQWYAAAEAARIMSADKTTDAKSASVLDGCVSAIERGWNKGTWVVQVEQYDEDTANPGSSTNSTMFCLGK